LLIRNETKETPGGRRAEIHRPTTFEHYVHPLVELEIHERRRRRTERHLNDSDLPRDKTWASLDRTRLPIKIAKQLATLCDGGFVERGDNLFVLVCRVVARPTWSAPSATG
jgi:hypothetical protein